MDRRIIGVIAAGVFVVGAAWFGLKGGGTRGGVGLLGAPEWQVGTDTDKLTGAKSPRAMLRQTTEGGGEIDVNATCDGSTIVIDFQYNAKNDTEANSAFETQGTGRYVHISYRIDSGEVQEAISRTDYPNTADAVFAYEMADAAAQPGDILTEGLNSLFGLGPRDLRAFLHAHEVRFGLPLANGTQEVVSIHPQDPSFREFVAACKIDLKAFDDDAAQKEASVKAAAQKEIDERARMEEEAKRQQEAAARQAEALKEACTNGERRLHVTGTSVIEGAADQDATTVYAFAGQTVDAIADPSAVGEGKCSIRFTRGDEEIGGKVPMSALEVADAVQPTAAPPGN